MHFSGASGQTFDTGCLYKGAIQANFDRNEERLWPEEMDTYGGVNGFAATAAIF